MGMVVQHNMNALSSYNKLNANVAGLKKSSEKLSSGYRINRAGDDAAGLAISEKMRSQIKGLNQAVRNSQDGINMIQTYEGAAQETHAILQRMKELATESANGTYDNATDRAAIQLEFDQLNDELNQIADTDFNGTVVLNGGQMADGLKAVNGEFNYANYVRDPKQLSAADVNLVDYQVFNDTDTTKGSTKADTIWNKLNANWDRSDASKANDGPDSVDITFKYDATGGDTGDKFWTAVSVTGGADLDQITPKSTANTGDTKNGGFTIGVGGTDAAKVVLDQSQLVNGDTITITLKNPNAEKSAPTLAGATVNDAATNFTEVDKTGSFKQDDVNFTVAVGAGATDANQTAGVDALFETLNGADFTAQYAAKAAWTDSDSKFSLTFTDPDGTTQTVKNAAAMNKFTITADGKKYEYGMTVTAAGVVTIGTLDTAGTGIDKALLTLTASKAADTTNESSGTVAFKLGIENSAFDSTAKPSVEVKAPQDSAVSKSNSFVNSAARMTYTDHIVLQTGARTKDSVDFTFNYNADKSADMGELKANLNLSARADGLNTENLSLATQDDANYAIDQIDKAINKTSMVRASFGSIQNRLEHKIENLTTTSTNLTEAESAIRDTDMASEMMTYTKYNILQQAAQSMLAQANQQPQSVLQLLG